MVRICMGSCSSYIWGFYHAKIFVRIVLYSCSGSDLDLITRSLSLVVIIATIASTTYMWNTRIYFQKEISKCSARSNRHAVFNYVVMYDTWFWFYRNHFNGSAASATVSSTEVDGSFQGKILLATAKADDA